jgi:two-component system sensor histidine kinase BaeS
MQLFNNLLENSLRYTDSGGRLLISASQTGRRIILDFADSGPASAINSWNGCASAFIVPKVRATAPAAAPDWGWRFVSTSWLPTAAPYGPTIRLLAGLALK